jgi:hypothetical protein
MLRLHIPFSFQIIKFNYNLKRTVYSYLNNVNVSFTTHNFWDWDSTDEVTPSSTLYSSVEKGTRGT